MTAEIAVMNKSAIALAADSKVTVTSAGVTKTYDTVSKLFTLSKVAPVGIMIYGNADFMGYPWETIIKMYRRSKGLEVEATVVNWAKDFFHYLDNFGNISKEDKEENAYSLCLSVILDVVRTYENWCNSRGVQPDEDGLRERLAARARRVLATKEWIAKRRHKALLQKLLPQIRQAINDTLDGYADETRREAIALLIGVIVLEESSPQMSGIVIAGFGEDEICPSLIVPPSASNPRL